MKLTLLAAAACAALLIPLGAANAATVFDFETIGLGTYASVAQSVGGLTATFSSTVGNIDIQSPGAPGVSGHVAINYFSGSGLMNADFSSAVTNVSIIGSDFQPSDVDHIFLAAYSGLGGTGTLLGSMTSAGCCSNGDIPGSAFVNAVGIRSVQFYTGAGDAFPGALYFDDLTVGSFKSAAPEPTTWAMLLMGFGGIGAMIRNRRRGVALTA
jgi:hypothetical protein